METLPQKVLDLLPHPEPTKPSEGFRIKVATPYVSPGSKQRVIEAIDNKTLSSASIVVNEFESNLKQFFSVPFVKACSSGFSALLLSLKLAGVSTGDDVLVPSLTMVAVVNSVLAVGANPVFIDCEATDQVNPSSKQYEQRITPSTKALIITHTYGIPADCRNLRLLCDERNIVMIEDIAEAIGVEFNGSKVGTVGDFACASLYANKMITSGDGGFVLSRREDKNLLTQIRSYINHGFCDGYHFVHFEESGNYKMSGIQAALVAPAVQDIPMIIKDRNRISDTYREYLEKIESLELLPRSKYGSDTPWVFGVIVSSKEKRRAVRQALANNGIETRDFFFPLHLQPMIIKRYGVPTQESFPNAEFLGTHGFYLPTYYGLERKDIKDICDCLIDNL